MGQNMQITNDLLDCLNLDTTSKRRTFLKTGAIIATAAQLWMPTAADARSFVKSGRTLQITNAHTGQKFQGEFWANGKYNTDAFKEIKEVFKDHRANETFPIDPRLLDIMYVLQQRANNTKNGYDLYSGYRSPNTNNKLRKASSGVAKKSLHMLGQAVDLRLPGTNLGSLRKDAIALKAGGVGYYPSSGFVHLDTGRVRSWT